VRSGRSRGVADLPIGAHDGLPHHSCRGACAVRIFIDCGAPVGSKTRITKADAGVPAAVVCRVRTGRSAGRTISGLGMADRHPLRPIRTGRFFQHMTCHGHPMASKIAIAIKQSPATPPRPPTAADRDLAQRVSYSSWRRHQIPVSLRPMGARSSHWYMPQRPSTPRA